VFQQVLIYILASAEQCVFTSVPLAATCVKGTWTRGGARGGHPAREQISVPVDVLAVNFWTRRTISRAVMEVKVGDGNSATWVYEMSRALFSSQIASGYLIGVHADSLMPEIDLRAECIRVARPTGGAGKSAAGRVGGGDVVA
jgi:hypothetical protein